MVLQFQIDHPQPLRHGDLPPINQIGTSKKPYSQRYVDMALSDIGHFPKQVQD